MSEAAEFVDRLEAATNAHDPDAIAACFAEGYENVAPANPQRNFTGRDQVRRNWEQILGFVPDLEAAVVGRAVHGDTVWSEWEMSGTRRDGSAHHMRGVIVFGVAGGVATWARFFLEPVESDSGTVDDAVRAQVVRA